MNQQEALQWIRLNRTKGLGGRGLCQLLKIFGTPEAILSATRSQLSQTVDDMTAEQIITEPPDSELADSQSWLGQAGNYLVTLGDAAYPKTLLEIPDPPPVLYAKGNLALLNTLAVAVVGSRHASPQGAKNAEDFSEHLSLAGFTIVSGMALGIDGAAHRGALKGSGATIAVIGTGIDIVYPAKHRDLAHQIAENGLIISEFPLGTPSRPDNFPRRNRIISGLSLGCLVVEANLQSGSLITARLAGEQGREVFAIPGSIHSPVSKGCHLLIKQGAKLVESVQDIVEELGHNINLTGHKIDKNASEPSPILDSMGYDPISMDALVAKSGLTAENLSAMLMVLELEGRISTLPGGLYQRLS